MQRFRGRDASPFTPRSAPAASASFVVLLFVVLLLWPSLSAAGDLAIEGAWIRLPPPKANTAAYMTLVNRGAAPIRITGVRSPSVEVLELHESRVEGGVASMRRIDAIEIPVGGRVTLAPRGLHLMLIRPGTLSDGATVELVFTIEGAEDQAFEVPVRREADAS